MKLNDTIYLQAHPDIQSYRNRSLINFNDLCLIYAHTTADGRYSMSSHDLEFDDDMMGLCIGVFLCTLRNLQNLYNFCWNLKTSF